MNERIVQSALRVQGQKKLPPKSKLRPEYKAMCEIGKGKRVLNTNPTPQQDPRPHKRTRDDNEDINIGFGDTGEFEFFTSDNEDGLDDRSDDPFMESQIINGEDMNEDIISNTEHDLQYVWLYLFTYYNFL